MDRPVQRRPGHPSSTSPISRCSTHPIRAATKAAAPIRRASFRSDSCGHSIHIAQQRDASADVQAGIRQCVRTGHQEHTARRRDDVEWRCVLLQISELSDIPDRRSHVGQSEFQCDTSEARKWKPHGSRFPACGSIFPVAMKTQRSTDGSQAIDLMDRTAGTSGLDGGQAVHHAKPQIASCRHMCVNESLAAMATIRLRLHHGLCAYGYDPGYQSLRLSTRSPSTAYVPIRQCFPGYTQVSIPRPRPTGRASTKI